MSTRVCGCVVMCGADLSCRRSCVSRQRQLNQRGLTSVALTGTDYAPHLSMLPEQHAHCVSRCPCVVMLCMRRLVECTKARRFCTPTHPPLPVGYASHPPPFTRPPHANHPACVDLGYACVVCVWCGPVAFCVKLKQPTTPSPDLTT